MPKPIFLAKVTVKYNKSVYNFKMVTTSESYDKLNPYEKYIVVRNVAGKKNTGRISESIFNKCRILKYKIIKTVGETNE